MTSREFQTCGFCHQAAAACDEPLVQYGTHHLAHLSCGLKKSGPAFLDRLTPQALCHLSAIVLVRFGLLQEVQRRLKKTDEAYLKIFSRMLELEKKLRMQPVGGPGYAQCRAELIAVAQSLWLDMKPAWIEGALRRRGLPKTTTEGMHAA